MLLETRQRFAPLRLCARRFLRHDRCELRCGGSISERKALSMKKVVSSLLGTALLFGAATFGLQSGTASAHDKHHKHHQKHHRHHRHHKNKLSY